MCSFSVVKFFLICLCPVFLFSGCALFLYPTGNKRVFEKGNVRASGYNNGYTDIDGRIKYGRIRIGNPKKPYDGAQNVSIKLPGGKVIDLDALKEMEIIKNAEFSFIPACCGFESWPAGSKEYLVMPGYFFVFGKDGKLKGFYAVNTYTGKGDRVSIGRTGGAFYSLPLSRGQLVDVFGAPDKLTRDWIDPSTQLSL